SQSLSTRRHNLVGTRGAILRPMTCKSLALLISAACLSSCTHAATAEREQSGASKVVGYAFYPEHRGYAPDNQRGLKVPEGVAADIAPDGTLGDHRFIATDLPDGGQHARRTIGVGPDGSLFVSIGSDCNVCTEPDSEHAAMLRIPPDLSTREVFARGLRNTIG